MLKKIILITSLLLMVMSGACFAEDKITIGAFLDAPPTYANNEKVRTIIPAMIKDKFPAIRFAVIPWDKTEMEVRTYKEDNRMVVNQYYSQPLNRADIQKIAKGLDCDYALFISINNSAPRVSAGFLTMSFKTTITCDVRLLDIASGKYIMSKQIIKDGSSTAFYAGVPSFDNAYNEALDKALKEIVIDTTGLQKPVKPE